MKGKEHAEEHQKLPLETANGCFSHSTSTTTARGKAVPLTQCSQAGSD